MIDQRDRAIYVLLAMVSHTYFNQVLKLFYSRPRPYMSSEQVECLGHVSLSFGDPSGHADFVASFYTTLWLALFAYPKKSVEVKRSTESSYLYEESNSSENNNQS